MDQFPHIRQIQALIRSGQLTPSELVDFCLDRIQRYDGQIHAWVLVDAAAARRAAERLTQLARSGQYLGPLHGVPIGIKDIIDVAGLPTRAGSPLRNDISPAEQDAPVVAALRRAGAIILGKTVTTEWACFDPPATRNPWHLQHTPGGSSSGSAAAVAMQMCCAALGTQTGGSIIRPAAYCGVSGLKPTYFPEMMRGIVPVSFHLDHVGPIARTVDDLSIVYGAMMGRENIAQVSEQTPTWSRLDEYFFEQADNGVRATVEAALAQLSAAPFEKALSLPKLFVDLHEHHFRIMAVDAAQVHREHFTAAPEQFAPSVASLIETGLNTPLSAYVASLRHQHAFRLDVLKLTCGAPLLVMPATTTTAPGFDTTGDPRLNSPWSYCGLPSLTIPCGLHDGLPVGLQLVGPYHTEPELLAAAAWCEQRLGFQEEPPCGDP